MKYTISTFTLIALHFLFGCKNHSIFDCNDKKIQYCAILDSVLTNKTLQKVIGIDSPKSNQPSIRFVNTKSKKFTKCESMYFFPGIWPIEVFVVPEPTFSLNTGQYRDIVLLGFKENDDVIEISLTAAHIENQIEKEGIPYFEFNFVKEANGRLRIDKVTIKQIREQRAPIDYNKLD